MGGDFQIDVESEVLSICGVSLDDYFNNDRRMEATILEENLDPIVSYIRNHVSHLAYHVLGFFIVKSGARVPINLKEEILGFTEWNIDKKVNWGEEWVKARKFYLEDLRKKLKLHRAGMTGYLIDLKFSKFPEFGLISVGLEQLKINFEARKFAAIEHINLDTCELLEFPDQILSFSNLKTLSLEHNKLNNIPDSINKLENLNALYLNGNNLNDIPDSIGDLKNLEIFDLRYNNLRAIPKSIQNLELLKSISLQKNHISGIPEPLKKLHGTFISI
ncbi:hypothetical protein LCGC14_1497090 [marine sediment metagenome]|uniref:Leucine-rich repeat domain-containing protein n=1 Tax=marine sediment metagenome TaxID=412755 RepID=A0A0F9M6P9_9ZZZZ